jgi:hypothetical protein
MGILDQLIDALLEDPDVDSHTQKLMRAAPRVLMSFECIVQRRYSLGRSSWCSGSILPSILDVGKAVLGCRQRKDVGRLPD